MNEITEKSTKAEIITHAEELISSLYTKDDLNRAIVTATIVGLVLGLCV